MPGYLVTVAPAVPVGPAENIHLLYLLAGRELSRKDVARLVAELLHDPVIQRATWSDLAYLESITRLPRATMLVEIAYKPGVTDNEAESVLEGARRLGVNSLETVRTLRRHTLASADQAAGLFNDLIQTTLLFYAGDEPRPRRSWYQRLLAVPGEVAPTIASVKLRAADDEELMQISRRGVLALDLTEMRTIRDYFVEMRREPSDGELETIAQTWSEHCSHKTFKAKVRYRGQGSGVRGQEEGFDPRLYPMVDMLKQGEVEIDSLIKTFLMRATDDVLNRRAETSPSEPQTPNPDPWVLSAFVDNAGIVAFGDEHEVSIKVETHNHPSALEPFGGANTGVGGVIRDVMGVSARPIANTDVLCFGPFDFDAARLSPGVLHPRRVCQGVVAGVRDYGNKLGIPTVNGAVLFDEGYTANPLVFCGTVGLAPRGRHPRQVQPGDVVVVLGGRTGRDGIHGATFSSEELTHTTAEEVGSAVQIGDPITEKKLLDVLLQARDQNLYSAITDCGAGGLSSAVGEMGSETGVQVELERVPLKYAGLQPWEIWLSEAQERMVIAVPPQHLPALLALCAGEDVEATPIGHFTDDHHLRVTYRGQTLVDLTMDFLHDGRPQRVLEAVWTVDGGRWTMDGGNAAPSTVHRPSSMFDVLLRLLAHPNIASKERIVRSYDHEVGGGTVVKPFVGVCCDGPGDAAVLRPLPASNAGLALGCGVNPRYGRIDPYWMALACVDEALRNVVAVGGDPNRTAILDNFCWGDPRQPDRMAGLVRAAAGCYDAAVAFGAPFVSGKDSLNNEYRDAQGNRVAIPPTLLITALAHVPDVRRAITMDLKEPGSYLYLIGETRDELAGSYYEAVLGADLAQPSVLPRVNLATAPPTFVAIHQAIHNGLVRACHDLSEGGLAVAIAEMAFAGELGAALQLELLPLGGEPANAPALVRLFAETPSRFLVEVRPADAAAFEAALAGILCTRVGMVTEQARLLLRDGATTLIDAGLAELKAAWQGGLEGAQL